MNLTRKEVIDLHTALQAVFHLRGKKFAYVVNKNIEKLEQEVRVVARDYKPKPDHVVYEQARYELCLEHCEKDAENKPITAEKNGVEQYRMKDQEAFDTAFKALQEIHKEALDKRQEQEKEYAELLDKNMPVDIHKIKLEFIPENITAEEMRGIWAILEEADEAEPKKKSAGAGLEAVK